MPVLAIGMSEEGASRFHRTALAFAKVALHLPNCPRCIALLILFVPLFLRPRRLRRISTSPAVTPVMLALEVTNDLSRRALEHTSVPVAAHEILGSGMTPNLLMACLEVLPKLTRSALEVTLGPRTIYGTVLGPRP